MKRRTFFKISLAAAAGAQIAPLGSMASTRTVPAFHLLTGIDAATSPEHLKRLLWVFAKNKLPVGCIIETTHSEGGTLTPEHPVARVIQEFLETDPGLLDIVAYVPDLGDLSHFFQARQCADARAALHRAIGPALKAARPIMTLACRQVPNPRAPDGARSAGFRNVVTLPDTDTEETTEAWSNGVVRSFGGRKVQLNLNSLATNTASLKPPHQLNLIDTEGVASTDPDELAEFFWSYAQQAASQEQIGQTANLSIADLQFRDNYQFERLLTLVLHTNAQQDADPNLRAFIKELKALKLPFHVLDKPDNHEGEQMPGYWVVTDDYTLVDQDTPSVTPFSFTCDAAETGTMSIDGSMPAGAGVGVILDRGAMDRQGIDLCDNLAVPSLALSNPEEIGKTLAKKLDNPRDMVLEIDAAALASFPRRRLLLKEIESHALGGVSRFVSLDEMARTIMPRSASIKRQRLTQAASPETAPNVNKMSKSWRAALIEDARIAWRYIQNATHPVTGLAKPTQNLNDRSPVKQFVTMWDVGSHINALVAAHKIGLITKEDFDRRISKILPQIRGRNSQERLLPQGYIRVDRNRWGVRDFDGCDTGRLLASLDNLRRNGGPVAKLEDLVASWDLDKIIVDGAIHSVINGELVSTFKSHCTHYATRAFQIWGLEAKSPYDVLSNVSRTDGEIALIEAAGWVGPIGAEPLLLEAMEIGMSQESSYLADVLFTAQLEEFKTSGAMISASESPINRPPWFIYNGLLLDKEDLQWSVDVVGGLNDYSDPLFLEENRLISTKAAYLWAAYHPHGFSNLLVSLVREKARTKHGFLSAVFSKTGEPTENYLDLNTNAIILEAIAYALANR